MNWLHNLPNPLLHLDLKPPNILLDKDYVVKIADFGISIFKDTDQISNNGAIGTPGYIAPELYLNPNKMPTEKADVYSFGILIWEIFNLKSPIPDEIKHMNIHAIAAHFYESIIKGLPITPEFPKSGVPEDIITLYNICTSLNPNDRLSFSVMKEESIMEKSILSLLGSEDPGRTFWDLLIKRKNFEKDDEVPWGYFLENFVSFFDLPSGAQSRYFLEFECLKHLVVVTRKVEKIVTEVVTFENFVRFLDWFGPISPTSAKVLITLHYIKKLYSKKYFFGFLDDHSANELLADAPNKYYLLRASQHKGCFTIMYKIKGELQKCRFDKVPDITTEVEAYAKKIKLLKPISGYPGAGILIRQVNISYTTNHESRSISFDFSSLVKN